MTDQHNGRGRGAAAQAALRDANQQRTATAAAATCARITQALETLGDDAPPRLAAAGRLRLAHPNASLTELGQLADVSKDALAGRIRRLLAMAGSREATS